MDAAGDSAIDIPPFIFRIEHPDVTAYRGALGVAGDRVPFGMALRSLALEPVVLALQTIALGKLPIHIAQDYRAAQPLCADVDYTCNVRLHCVGQDRLRIEQRLSDATGNLCLTLTSDIALVSRDNC